MIGTIGRLPRFWTSIRGLARVPVRHRLSAVAVVLLAVVTTDPVDAQAAHTQPVRDTGRVAITAPLSPVKSPEEKFLQLLADQYEGLRLSAHNRMMDVGGHAAHGKLNDPASLDGQADMLQRDVLELLSGLYKDVYSPRASGIQNVSHDVTARTPSKDMASKSAMSEERRAGNAISSGKRAQVPMSAGMTLEMEASHEQALSETAARFRAVIATIDAYHTRIRRPEIHKLVTKQRALLVRSLAALEHPSH